MTARTIAYLEALDALTKGKPPYQGATHSQIELLMGEALGEVSDASGEKNYLWKNSLIYVTRPGQFRVSGAGQQALLNK